MELQAGQTALVTGAGSGIGRALALAFRAAGLNVVATDVNAAALEALSAETVADGVLASFHTTLLDVRDAAAVEALAAGLEASGGIDVLCNNAGVLVPRPLWEHGDAEWRWLFDVNVHGVMNGIRAFVPRLLASGRPAHIVNTCSMGGFLASPMLGAYGATKFAVRALTESLHYDLRLRQSKIGVSLLAPGAVKTGIFDGRTGVTAADAASESAREMMRQGTAASGMEPAALAALVLAAIRADRYWIFPHGYMLPAVTENAAAVVAMQTPVFDFARAWKTGGDSP
ncbi:MAG: SDR family NAD(P)-dependent oxidoreductase [Gammaproteobacteria bacterium]